MAEKVVRKLKEEVEDKGLKLSITEKREKEKSEMITSCRYPEEKLRECSQKGVSVADSVETLGVDLRTPTKQLGTKGKSEKEQMQCDIHAHQEKSDLPEKSYEDWCETAVEDGIASRESGRQAVGISPKERLKLRRQMAAAAGKQESVSLSLFMEAKCLDAEEGMRVSRQKLWC